MDEPPAHEPPGQTARIVDGAIRVFVKTTPPGINTKQKGVQTPRWDIHLSYRPKANVKKIPKTTAFVGTKEEANVEAEIFRVAIEIDGGVHWLSQSKRILKDVKNTWLQRS